MFTSKQGFSSYKIDLKKSYEKNLYNFTFSFPDTSDQLEKKQQNKLKVISINIQWNHIFNNYNYSKVDTPDEGLEPSGQKSPSQVLSRKNDA